MSVVALNAVASDAVAVENVAVDATSVLADIAHVVDVCCFSTHRTLFGLKFYSVNSVKTLNFKGFDYIADNNNLLKRLR